MSYTDNIHFDIVSWPVLYKKTSTGAIQYWQISVTPNSDHSVAYDIYTEYGQVGTESPQETADMISKGKNEGKKNKTSVRDQAINEAQAKWEKQLKKGYVETPAGAMNDETDDLIEGGIVPMLAQSFSKQGHKIKYPCYVQPKLDGIRCIAILKDGKCTLWSRTRKRIASVPHIVAELEQRFKGEDIILDGELYAHQFKDNFEHIVSLVRQEEPASNCTDVEYHIYDVVNDLPFSGRAKMMACNPGFGYSGGCVKFVDTNRVASEAAVADYFELAKAQGYEGAMLRNADGKYLNKRSYDLQKVKEFQDEEFEIIGAEEGRGKLAGHVGAFVCQMSDGKQFLAKMSGDTEKLAEYFRDPSTYLGKQLTVKFQGLTGANQVPRFPVGVRIRTDL